MRLDLARAVADAVLYEGYLLYPYRASSDKNRSRWQFGVLGPVGAHEHGLGEAATMSMQGLLSGCSSLSTGRLVVHLRLLQLQHREVRDADDRVVPELAAPDGTTWLTWDEAVEQELTFEVSATELADGVTHAVHVDGGEDAEELPGDVGRIVRRRWPLEGRVVVGSTPSGTATRLDLGIDNLGRDATDSTDATRRSLIGAHVIVEAHEMSFLSVIDPPDDVAALVDDFRQDRCWPVLGGDSGDTDLLLGLPIILGDHPEVAAESAGALYDATEIDEILTLRVLTMTDAEKAEARATDPRARAIIDRCDDMTPETLQQLHGVFRDPHGTAKVPDLRDLEPPTFTTEGEAWWDPAADESVDPETDSVTIDGVPVAKGSLVRVHPNRRADAHDMFFDGQVARVTSVLSDLDGGTHVALVLVDDPASDMHEWYGRYFYFAPDELEPVLADSVEREETHS